MSKLKTAMVLILMSTIDVSGLALDTLSTRATNILARDVSVDAPYRDPNSAPNAKHGVSMHQGSRLRRQVSLSGCVMPYSTPYGTYSLRSPLKIEGGQLAPYNSIIDLTCPPGLTSPQNSVTFCDAKTNGWYEELGTCLRMCKHPQFLTVDFTCSVPGRDGKLQEGPCDATIPSGSTASAKCRDGYHSITNSRSITCLDGEWGYDMASCTAECGKVTLRDTPNIINRTIAFQEKFPWHVAIYYQGGKNLPPIYICGGSIITSTIVISAAHCFYNASAEKQVSANLFKAAVGKLYSDFDHPEESTNEFIQKFDVKRIEIPENYRGITAGFSHDLALIILEKPIVFSSIIMPVCLNLNDEIFDEEQSSAGQQAKVAGFGLASVSSNPYNDLKTAVMPIVPKYHCNMESPKDFPNYIVWDKLCAGQIDGVRVCEGDNGGGLVVSSFEKYNPTWHLRGIVSAFPSSETNDTCTTIPYSVYTKPFAHRDFIRNVIERQVCEMPSNPPNGKYVVAGIKNASPGEGVRYKSRMTLQCDPGFISSDDEDNICDGFIDDWNRDLAECVAIPTPEKKPPQMVGCIMPYSTSNKTFSLQGPINIEGGQLVPHHSVVEWKCPSGFFNSKNVTTFCDARKNDWYGELGMCQRMCKRPQSLTVDFTCSVLRDGGQIYKGPCDAAVLSGSTASPECREGYYSTANLKSITCQNGQWVYVMPSCTAKCGKITPRGEQHIITGKPAVRGEFPWHVAIYSQYGQEGKNSTPEYVCGGSIITSTIAISAAHCFYDPNAKKTQSAKLFKVAVGKLYSDFAHPEENTEEFIQKFDVKRIEIPEYYRGITTSYAHDLALIILEKPIVFSDIIMPVCIDLRNENFEELQSSPGQQAKIAGFGLTNVRGNVSHDLQTAVMPIVSKFECTMGSPGDFEKYIIWDKLCAGQKTGTGVCKGDSGGGLVVMSIEKYSEIWHLRGIVSSSPRSTTGDACTANTYSVYTKPFRHREFIENVIERQGCEIPSNPPNGKFVVIGIKNASPGEGVRHKTRMTLQCDPGFIPSDDEDNICDEFINDWIRGFAECVAAGIQNYYTTRQ